eukprot:scaffold239328_cov32-Prasinocladus_malaysianus.AAC.1
MTINTTNGGAMGLTARGQRFALGQTRMCGISTLMPLIYSRIGSDICNRPLSRGPAHAGFASRSGPLALRFYH